MQQVKKHIVFKLFTLFVATILLVPTAVKFTHAFTHHNHKVCKGYQTTHIHKVDLDCDFYKFKLTNNFIYCQFNFDFFIEKFQLQDIISQYHFLSEYQRLQTSLRGPPQLI